MVLNSSYKLRKIVVLVAILFSVGIFSQFLFSSVHATDIENVNNAVLSGINVAKEGFADVNLVKKTRDKFNIFIFNKTSASTDGSILNRVMTTHSAELTNFSMVVSAIASGLIIIYMLIYIMRESMRGDPTFDFWIKVFFMFAIAIFMTTQWSVITNKISDVGRAILNNTIKVENYKLFDNEVNDKEKFRYNYETQSGQELAGGLEYAQFGGVITKIPETITPAGAKPEVEDAIHKNKQNFKNAIVSYDTYKKNPTDENKKTFFDDLMNLLGEVIGDNEFTNYLSLSGIEDLVMRMSLLAVNVAIDGQLFFIALQLLIRRLLAPIALADVTIEGTRSPGVRYLKRYFALYLQCVIILVFAAFLCWFMKEIVIYSSETTDLSNLFKMRLVVLMIGMTTFTAGISQSGNLANEIIGD